MGRVASHGESIRASELENGLREEMGSLGEMLSQAYRLGLVVGVEILNKILRAQMTSC